MNPYSAPTEVHESPQDEVAPTGGHVFWLVVGFTLTLLSIPRIHSAIYRGPVSSELQAAIILVVAVACLNQAQEAYKKRRVHKSG